MTLWRLGRGFFRNVSRSSCRIGLLFVAFLACNRVIQVRVGEALHFHGLLTEHHWFFRSLRWSGAAGTDWVVWSRLSLSRSDGVLSGWLAVPLVDELYTSQFGLGTWVLTAIVAPFGELDESLRLMYSILALAVVLSLVILRRILATLLGSPASFTWLMAFFLPWGLTMWSSAYWNFPVRVLPCLVLPWATSRFAERLVLKTIFVSVPFAFVALSNYELITLTIFLTLGLALTLELCEDSTPTQAKSRTFEILVGFLVAGTVAVVIHVLQLCLIAGSVSGGLSEFLFNFSKRSVSVSFQDQSSTASSFEVLWRVLGTQVLDPISLPLLGGVPFILLLGLNFVLFVMIQLGWRRDSVLRPISAACILTLSSTAGVAVWIGFFAPHIDAHMPFGRGALFFSAVPSSLALLVLEVRALSIRRTTAVIPLWPLRASAICCVASVSAAIGLRAVLTQF